MGYHITVKMTCDLVSYFTLLQESVLEHRHGVYVVNYYYYLLTICKKWSHILTTILLRYGRASVTSCSSTR